MSLTTPKEWMLEIADFFKSRITAILSGSFLMGAFFEATFVNPNIIERCVLIVSTFILGWYFSHKYYEVEIALGTEELKK